MNGGDPCPATTGAPPCLRGQGQQREPPGEFRMKIKKLFQVLVLGGTTLGLGLAACGGSDTPNNTGNQQQLLPDGGPNPNPGGGPPGW